LEQECRKLQSERTELLNNVSQVRHVMAARRLTDISPVIG
jgi:hypothetical protein